MSAPLPSAAAPAAAAIPVLDGVSLQRLMAAGKSNLSARLRSDAFERARSLPPPWASGDEWSRTRPEWFPFASARPVPPPVIAPGAPSEHPLDPFFDVVVEIRNGECRLADRSGVLASGRLKAEWLSDAGDGVFERFATPVLAVPGLTDADPLPLLNDAFWNQGLSIRVPDGGSLARGVLVRLHDLPDGALQVPRLLLEVGDGCEFNLAVLADGGGEASLVLGSIQARIGSSSTVGLIQLQHLAPGACWLSTDAVSAGRGSTLNALSFNLGGRVSKSKMGIEAAGPGADVRLGGLYFAGGAQHVDFRTLQVHSSPDTRSDLLYKGAACDSGRSVYQGVIVAKRGAVRIDAYQRNNNLLLNDGAKADSLPGLLIDADDLRCTHGATIGALDPDQLFYLRARGLPAAAARRLLLEGFFEDIVRRIPYDALREEVRRMIGSRLAAGRSKA